VDLEVAGILSLPASDLAAGMAGTSTDAPLVCLATGIVGILAGISTDAPLVCLATCTAINFGGISDDAANVGLAVGIAGTSADAPQDWREALWWHCVWILITAPQIC